MMRSLYSGVSGLQNHQVRMDVIGNNISNVNTTGFKKGRVNFQDMLSQTLSGAAKPTDNIGGVNAKQVGLGMMIASIDTLHTQGSLQSTGNKLDLAIAGNGFFMLKDGDKAFYTRAGVFGLDKDGLLVNPGTGLRVQGWTAKDVGGEYLIRSAEDPGDIILPMYSKDPAKATQNVDFKCNLDQTFPEIADFATFDGLTEGEQMKNSWVSSINIYDNFGNPIEARFTFIKTGTNQWQSRVDMFRIDPDNPKEKIQIEAGNYNLSTSALDGTGADGVMGQNEFTLNFNNLGQIISVTDQGGDTRGGEAAPGADPITGELNIGLTLNMPTGDENLQNQQINFQVNMGEIGKVRTEEGVGVTQFSSDFSTKPFRQDGYSMGYLEDIKVDNTGAITGVYSNGNNRILAQVAVANFSNPRGLEKVGETNFVYSNNSGLPDIGVAGSVGKGKIIAGTLEMSNVDLAEQFTDMIVTQRGFQANSKTIQTTDQMLQELMSLKR